MNPMKCDVFTLGYAAPMETRHNAGQWRSGNYPDVPIVALKSPSDPDIEAAHFSVELGADEPLLATLAEALNSRRRPC